MVLISCFNNLEIFQHLPLFNFKYGRINVLFKWQICSGRIPVVFFSVRPHIVPFEFESPIFAGQAAQVTCLVNEGDQPFDISWSFQASHTSSQNGITTNKIGNRASLLLIDPADSGHIGNYTCTVRNPVGVVNYTASLKIHGTISLVWITCCLTGLWIPHENPFITSDQIDVR